MSKIKNAFTRGKALLGFVTGGDPTLAKSEEIILEMIRGGADLIEIGVPFSDPVAEGPVIQRANLRALSSGANLYKLFELVASVRRRSDVPLVFLSYLNPVLRYGYEAFFQKCRQIGLDGIIIPDLPFEEQEEVRSVSSYYNVDLISLIAPTSHERAAKIAKTATGFLYIVSSMGVTGIRKEITTDLSAMVAAARSASAGYNLPAAVGFGISTPEQAARIAQIADGVIVGSAIVKIIEEYGEAAGKPVYDYVKRMKESLSPPSGGAPPSGRVPLP